MFDLKVFLKKMIELNICNQFLMQLITVNAQKWLISNNKMCEIILVLKIFVQNKDTHTYIKYISSYTLQIFEV